MDSDLYTILSLAGRLWFLLLGCFLVGTAFYWLYADHRAKAAREKNLPIAGMVGFFVVLSDSPHLPKGTTLPVPMEGVLGASARCDVRVNTPDVAETHLDLVYKDGVGLYVLPYPKLTCLVEGQEIRTRLDSKANPLVSGSLLQIGETQLRWKACGRSNAKKPARARR